MNHFCTYFDHKYMALGLALYRSLRRNCKQFTLWVLCLSDECHKILGEMALPDVQLIRMEEFEKDDAELKAAKANRTRVEYFFTCTPSLPLYIFNRNPGVQCITYLDSDLYFFGDPQAVFDEMGDQSVAIIAHGFASWNKHLEKAGIYNVGWVSFRRDNDGLACLRWWREQCLECCTFDLDAGKAGDQKYLDDWPTRFRNVAVIQHKGANVAPWNIGARKFSVRDDRVFADDDPVIFVHFHGLKRITGPVYDSGLTRYRSRLPKVVRRRLFAPYVRELSEVSAEISPLLATVVQHGDALAGMRPPSSPIARLVGAVPRFFGIFQRLLKGNYVLIVGGRLV